MWRKSSALLGSGIAASYTPADVAISYPLKTPKSMAEGTAMYRKTEQAALHHQGKTAGFFSVPHLSYPILEGVPPVLSRESIEHTRKVIHQDVVDQLNFLTLGTMFEGHPVDVVLQKTSFDATHAAIHSLAAEHLNMSLMWKSIIPWGSQPNAAFKEALHQQYSKSHPSKFGAESEDHKMMNENQFPHRNPTATSSSSSSSSSPSSVSSVDVVGEMMCVAGMNHQRDGWVHLIHDGKEFNIVTTDSGQSPLGSYDTAIPLVTLSVQHHMYMVDYASICQSETEARERYLKNAVRMIHWGNAGRVWDMLSRGEGGESSF